MQSTDVLFLVLGAVMILSMHGGFAFLEAGTVSKKNQVNAFNKIIFDWATTTIMYFMIGFPVAYGVSLIANPDLLTSNFGYEAARFFFLVGFAACIPAIISGGVVGRIKFSSQALAGIVIAAFIYPFFESLVWGQNSLIGQSGSLFAQWFGKPMQDYAGSVVVHSIGGWIALPAIIILGPRTGRFGRSFDNRPSNIPFLVLGSWVLIVGWFGFNLMSAQKMEGVMGLVAINSLMAMVGGTLSGLLISKNDIGFTHNGALAGLIAVCAGVNVVHPLAALAIGIIAGIIFKLGYEFEINKLKIDDVLGVWPLHGLNGTWGGIAAGIFGQKMFGGTANLSFAAQLVGSLTAVVYAVVCSSLLYGVLKFTVGLRMSEHDEMIGSDRTFHNIEAYPEESL